MHRSLVPLLALLLLIPATASAKPNKRVCGPAAAGSASCHARVVTDAKGHPGATAARGTPAGTAAPSGYAPADLQSAYALPSATAGAGKVVAIVDAYDDPA